MRICLISMPWMSSEIPQMSLATLAAYLRRHAPSYQIEPRYEYLAVWEKISKEYDYVVSMRSQGELIYLGHLFPDRKEIIKQQLLETPQTIYESDSQFGGQRVISKELFETCYQITGQHLLELADDLARQPYAVIGCSVSADQLFSSLALSKLVKERNSKAHIVFGGAIVSPFAHSILHEFPFVDYVIPGEGEVVFLDFLRGIEQGEKQFGFESGVLSASNLPPTSSKENHFDPAHIPDFESLPMPDFSEYAENAERLSINWSIPIETSRGCWWRRVEKTQNPFDACYFCSFAARRLYREKKPQHIADEMNRQMETCQRNEILFTDVVLRADGVTDLARQITLKNKHPIFSFPVRSTVTPMDLLSLKEAGCYSVLLGIEGFSDSFLKRINKGTTVIQNLQALKTCYELDIQSICPLLYCFPGTTQNEIDDTISNISRYSICYSSVVALIAYSLVMDSTVFERPNAFNISEIRTRKDFRLSFPPELEKLLPSFWLEYRDLNPSVEYAGLVDAVTKWLNLHEQLKNDKSINHSSFQKPLYYLDGGTYLMIIDQRNNYEEITMDCDYRDLYLYCMRIRSRNDLFERFGSTISSEKIEKEILPSFLERNIMFSNNNLFLSLAVAYKPEIAATRIRQDFHKENSNI